MKRRKPKRQRKEKLVTFWATQDFYDALEEAAHKAEEPSVSQFIRKTLVERVRALGVTIQP